MIILSASILISFCMAISTSFVYMDPVTAGTELVFAFMVHRHGDRTPIKQTLNLLLNDEERLKSLIEPWGYGQLTDAGRLTGYKTGKFIRRRYKNLIGDKYNKSEMYIRSTDSKRTKLTILTAMRAVYPDTNNSWNKDVNRVNKPYTVVPVKYDYNLPFLNCPTFQKYLRKLISDDTNSGELGRFSHMFKNGNLKISQFMVYLMNDAVESLISLGYALPATINLLKDEISRSADKAIDKIWGNSEYLHFQAGVLLNEFFENADKIIRGENTQKVRVHSGHDFNVYSIEAISRAVPRQGVPKYGSLFALELRRVKTSGQYVVLPVYLADPHDNVERYLHIDGCSDLNLCDYEKFRALTSTDRRTEAVWRNECGFTEDMYIDTSSID